MIDRIAESEGTKDLAVEGEGEGEPIMFAGIEICGRQIRYSGHPDSSFNLPPGIQGEMIRILLQCAPSFVRSQELAAELCNRKCRINFSIFDLMRKYVSRINSFLRFDWPFKNPTVPRIHGNCPVSIVRIVDPAGDYSFYGVLLKDQEPPPVEELMRNFGLLPDLAVTGPVDIPTTPPLTCIACCGNRTVASICTSRSSFILCR